MAIKAFPFDSKVNYNAETGRPEYDRPATARELRDFYKALVGNGVYLRGSNNFYVQANGAGVRILAGLCAIEGAIGRQDEDELLSLPVPTTSNTYDHILLRFDNNMEKRTIEVVTRRTTSETITLERTQEAWELQLARILRPANSTIVTQSNIADMRGNANVCGWVHGVVEQVDTSTIFNQFDAWLAEIQSKWEIWWNGQQGGVEGYMLQSQYDPGQTGAVNNTRNVGDLRAIDIERAVDDIDSSKMPYSTLKGRLDADDTRLTGTIGVFDSLRATGMLAPVESGRFSPDSRNFSNNGWTDWDGYLSVDNTLKKGLLTIDSNADIILKKGYHYNFFFIPFISYADAGITAVDMRAWKVSGDGVFNMGFDGTSSPAKAVSNYSTRLGELTVDCTEATTDTRIRWSARTVGAGAVTLGKINIITNISKYIPFHNMPS